MTVDSSKRKLNWAEVDQMVGQVVQKIKLSGWQPDVVIALSRGGFVPATMIAYRLGVKNLAGLDARKNDEGLHFTGYLVSLKPMTDQKVLIVDDGIITGHLLTIAPREVERLGGEPRTCALISEGKCADPDYLVKTETVIPHFPWE